MADEVNQRLVSFDDEPLVLVNEDDEILGYLDKASAHRGSGVLHRAFSIFLFRSDGSLIIQRRAEGKPLWPGYWSNTCCSHPRRGEAMETAAQRRLQEELGVACDLSFLYRFRYQAQYDADGAEHELCSVYAGRTDAPLRINRTEIAETREIRPDALDRALAGDPESYTPWFRMEWQRIRAAHADWIDDSPR